MPRLPLFVWRERVLGSQLPPTARLVALTLSCHMNSSGENGFAGISRLAQETGLAVSTVRRDLTLLADSGYLTRNAGGGRGRRSIYTAVIAETVQEVDCLTPVNSPGHGPFTPINSPPHSRNSPPGSKNSPGGGLFQSVNSPPGRQFPERKGSQDLKTEVQDLKPEVLKPTSRKRDVLWDVFVELFGEPGTNAERGAYNAGLKQLRDQQATPDQIRQRVAEHQRRGYTWTLTPNSLATWWGRLGRPSPTSNGRQPRSFAALQRLSDEPGRIFDA